MEVLKAYLTFPRDSTTNAILLQTKWEKRYAVTFNGLSIDKCTHFTQRLLKNLADRGAKVEVKDAETYTGKNVLFGVQARTEILNNDLIRVRVEGQDLESMMYKIRKIKEGMARFGYQPKVCQWDRVGRLGL